jgi:hypothetical protein
MAPDGHTRNTPLTRTAVREALRSPGQPLDSQARALMEPRFRHDFSTVRVHTDGKAAESARSMNAVAYTVGNDVVFGTGRYTPQTTDGQQLLAHELTHVVQQRAARPISPDDFAAPRLTEMALEREAAIAAARVAGGLSVGSLVQGRAAVLQPQLQSTPGAATTDQPEKPAEKDPVQVEWDAHPKVHGHFNGGFADYKDLRPLYMSNTGTDNPAKWIEDNIVSVKFFDRSTPAHIDMKPKVTAAEKTLKDASVEPTMTDFWSFVPRRIRGATTLSQHALGKAVDINAAANPRITDEAELAALTLITGLDFQSSNLSATDLKTKSDDFKTNFNEAKYKEILDGKEKEMSEAAEKAKDAKTGKEEKAALNATIKDLKKTIANLKSSKSALLALAKTGFLNLDTQLIQAFIDAGFTWGGQFQHSKDFMHFEIA